MHTSEDEKSINKLRPYRSSLHFFSLDIMTNYNSFELVFCFVFNAFLNLVSSISLFFKFGNVWKKQPLEMFNKKVFLIVLQNWNWRKVPVLEQAWNIIKKESPAKEFFCDFCKICLEHLFIEHFRVPVVSLLLETPFFIFLIYLMFIHYFAYVFVLLIAW